MSRGFRRTRDRVAFSARRIEERGSCVSVVSRLATLRMLIAALLLVADRVL